VSSAPSVAFALPRGVGEPSFSADGKKIVYTSWDGHDSEIYTINSNGTGKFQLTNNGTIDQTPSYSPDGKKIAYTRGPQHNSSIYTINVGGGGKSKVTEDSNPAWGSRP
jgi:TolB protein